MGFDAIERSNYDGAPSKLFEFTLDETVWRYCDGQNDITLDGTTYTSIPISHGGITLSGDTSADEMTVNIASSAEVATLFIGTPPSDPVAVRIRSLHRGDTETPVIWSGTVKSHREINAAEGQFVCNSLLSTLNRNGLRLSWERGCPHALYDRSCRVDPADYATTVQIDTLVGATITSSGVSALGDGYLAGGFLTFVGDHDSTERRAIESHVGDTFSLLGAADGLSEDQWITVYPGCDRVTATCESKFNNLANYGGFPHLPTKSPFDGDPVF